MASLLFDGIMAFVDFVVPVVEDLVPLLLDDAVGLEAGGLAAGSELGTIIGASGGLSSFLGLTATSTSLETIFGGISADFASFVGADIGTSAEAVTIGLETPGMGLFSIEEGYGFALLPTTEYVAIGEGVSTSLATNVVAGTVGAAALAVISAADWADLHNKWFKSSGDSVPLMQPPRIVPHLPDHPIIDDGPSAGPGSTVPDTLDYMTSLTDGSSPTGSTSTNVSSSYNNQPDANKTNPGFNYSFKPWQLNPALRLIRRNNNNQNRRENRWGANPNLAW